MDLPDRYNKNALLEILANAKKDVEHEYGCVFLSEPICERLVEHCREMVISYNSQVALEEMKREIVDLIKRW